MKSPFHIQTLYPSRMTTSAKTLLCDRLYTIHQQIFEGVSKADFRKYVIEPDTRLTRIYIYQNLEKKDLGYLSFQVFEAGRRLVIRTEVGFLPRYRRYNITLPTLIRDALAYQVSHHLRSLFQLRLNRLFQRAYFLATPVHPTPYKIGIQQLPLVWPHPGRKMPQRISKTLDRLKKQLKIEAPSLGSGFSCKVGWKVKEPQILRDRIMSRKDPVTQFYLRHNPHYSEGNGLLMLVPLSFRTYAMGYGGLIKKRMGRVMRWTNYSIFQPILRWKKV